MFHFYRASAIKFTACPTCSDIFQSSKQSSNPKLIGLFFHVSVKRDPWALASSFETCHCRCDRLYVPALSTDKQKTNTQRITNDHVSAAKSRVEIREILPPAQTHTMDERSQIHPEYARKNQTTLNALSTDKMDTGVMYACEWWQKAHFFLNFSPTEA